MTGGTEDKGVGGERGASGDDDTSTQIWLMSGRKPGLITVKTVQWIPGLCHHRQSCELDIFVCGLLFLLKNSSSFPKGLSVFQDPEARADFTWSGLGPRHSLARWSTTIGPTLRGPPSGFLTNILD